MPSIYRSLKTVGPKLVPFLKAITIYLVIFPEKHSIVATLLKCLPILSLILFTFWHESSTGIKIKYTKYIQVGLAFGCIGDAFLVWPGYFAPGMIAFGIGHVFYILAFGLQPFKFTQGVVLMFLHVAAIFYLFPGVDGIILQIGVPIYITLLGVMVWRAFAQAQWQDRNKWNKMSSAIGALLFSISDLLIGINAFRMEINHAQAFIMPMYYAGQLGIALSIVDSISSTSKK